MCHGQMIGAALSRLAGQGGSRCGQCKRDIEAGERLTSMTCKQDGEFHVLLVCSDCSVERAKESWLTKLRRYLR